MGYWGVKMHIGEGLQDQLVTPILDLGAGVGIGKGFVNPADDAVLRHQIAAVDTIQLAEGGSGDDGSF